MLLNRIEKAVVNNPARVAFQRYVEARRLLKMGGRIPNEGSALEIGCGSGGGVGLILDVFGAERVDAFDLDPDMIMRARRRLSARGDRVRLWQGDVTRIPVADESYTAVFDFFIIHHVPNWRDALREVYRVLKPGGRFYAEEILAKLISMRLARLLFEHPQEDRFDLSQFRDALVEQGFEVLAADQFMQWAGWIVADKPA